jgi:hypothetical protein
VRSGGSRAGRRHERTRPRFRSPATRWPGLVEYALLALIGLGVAITFAMAIVDP